MANLQKLATAGIRVTIDDFGAGYSSLAYLVHRPLEADAFARLI